MSRTLKVKLGALGASSLLLVGVAVAAIGLTGAYFSETKAGEIKGNTGSIHVATSGGEGVNGLTFDFKDLLPGEPQTATAHYENTGLNNEAVWVVFNNAEALHSLNNLGSYGEVTLRSDGKSIFHSVNLDDNLPPASGTCGEFTPKEVEPGVFGCWPLKEKYLLAADIAPGATGNMQFSFAYASKLKSPAAEDQPFNAYPPEVEPSQVKGTGLPYEIVATQVGQQP